VSKSKSAKKKGPWIPGKTPVPLKVAQDLGLSGHRLNQSKSGFEAEPVGIGHHRLREKAMLTHYSLLAERRNAKLRACLDQGKEPEDLQITQTPSDRAVAMWQYLLWSYMETIYQIVEGKSGKTNYEKSSHSSDLNRLPLTEKQFNLRKFCGWVEKQPGGKELASYLTQVAAQCNPQAFPPDYPVMSHAEIGAWLLDHDATRECKVAATGALALACRILAGMSAVFAAQERNEKYRKSN